MGKVYGMLRNLWAVIDSTPFVIHMQPAKTFLIPVLLYGSEIFANCDTDDRRKLHLAYNNIARYVFIKGINFDNLLNIKCLRILRKIITLEQPIYLFRRIRFARSNRGNKIIQCRHWTFFFLSQWQFFIHKGVIQVI